MAREGNWWVNVRRRLGKGQSGGGHVYIDNETLLNSLKMAEIPLTVPLVCRRYAVKDIKGTAKIILKIRSKEKVAKTGELD